MTDLGTPPPIPPPPEHLVAPPAAPAGPVAATEAAAPLQPGNAAEAGAAQPGLAFSPIPPPPGGVITSPPPLPPLPTAGQPNPPAAEAAAPSPPAAPAQAAPTSAVPGVGVPALAAPAVAAAQPVAAPAVAVPAPPAPAPPAPAAPAVAAPAPPAAAQPVAAPAVAAPAPHAPAPHASAPPAPAAPAAPIGAVGPVGPAAPAAAPEPAQPAATIDADSYARAAAAIEREVHKVIVGQDELVRALVIAMLCEGHVLLEGVPGLGKTQLLKTLAQVTGLPFARIQFTPDLMPADILGTYILVEEEGHRRFDFRAGPVFACLVLADEVNRGTPKVQSALLEAMAERTATVGGRTWALPRPFLVMATQNPIEMEGTYPLPEAQLDRFFFKLSVGFPAPEELEAILERTTDASANPLQRLADGRLLNSMIALTRTVLVPRHVRRHAVDLVVATHTDGARAPKEVLTYVRYGASPRGAQALVMAAKAAALLDGRPNASVADVRAMAKAALRHRLVLGYEANADGVSADAVVDAVLAAVPEPSG